MFISNKEKKEIWTAMQQLTEIVNQLRLDIEKAKNGWRISDGEPRIKRGRPVGSKNKPKVNT
jgi:hypothetical protein